MKKQLALFLAVLILAGSLFVLSSCKKEEETPEEQIENFIVANGKDNACTIVYAYGSDGKHRTRLRLAESIAAFVFQQCGVKPTVTDDREPESDGYEVLLGETNRSFSSVVRAEIQDERTFIIRAADKKLVIAAGSDLALSEAVNTMIATTKQLNYKSSKKDGTMSFRNGYNYTKTLAAVITDVEHIGFVTTMLSAGAHCVIQGGCTDGTYIYVCMEDQKTNGGKNPENYENTAIHTTVIYKLNAETLETVAKSEPLYLDHANDMTYDAKTGELIVVHSGNGQGRNRILSFVDPENMTLLRTCTTAFEGGYAAAYSASKDILVTAHVGEYKYYKGDYRNADGTARETLVRINHPTYRNYREGSYLQSIDCDDDYIYGVLTGDGADGIDDANFGYVVISTWEGKYVATCRIPLPEGENEEIETENIFHIGNTFYVIYNSRTSSHAGHIHRFTIEGLSRTGG